jgi:hypothetical protein
MEESAVYLKYSGQGFAHNVNPTYGDARLHCWEEASALSIPEKLLS